MFEGRFPFYGVGIHPTHFPRKIYKWKFPLSNYMPFSNDTSKLSTAMSSLLPLQFMGVGICSPFNSDHAECFAYVSANNVRPIRTYVSANIHFLAIIPDGSISMTVVGPSPADSLGWMLKDDWSMMVWCDSQMTGPLRASLHACIVIILSK